MSFQEFLKKPVLELIRKQNNKVIHSISLKQLGAIKLGEKIYQLYLKKKEIDFLVEYFFAQHLNFLFTRFGKSAFSKNLVFIPVLKGGAYIENRIRNFSKLHFSSTEFIGIKSYQNQKKEVKSDFYLNCADDKLAKKHLIIIDEIIDTGETIKTIVERFSKTKALSINIFASINKLTTKSYLDMRKTLEPYGVFTTAINFPADYWAVGSLLGMDDNQLCRATLEDLYIAQKKKNWSLISPTTNNPYAKLENLIADYKQGWITQQELADLIEKTNNGWFKT